MNNMAIINPFQQLDNEWLTSTGWWAQTSNIFDEDWTIKDHWYLQSANISRDDYFMDIARVVGEKCTCDRWKCGCVIVKNNNVISSWFANAPEWSPTCDMVWHLMMSVINEKWETEEHCMRNSCAEQIAIANAAKNWISLNWATLYVTMTPCTIRHCAHMIVASGIKKVVCDKRWHHAHGAEWIFKRAWIMLTYLSDEVAQYPSK